MHLRAQVCDMLLYGCVSVWVHELVGRFVLCFACCVAMCIVGVLCVGCVFVCMCVVCVCVFVCVVVCVLVCVLVCVHVCVCVWFLGFEFLRDALSPRQRHASHSLAKLR